MTIIITNVLVLFSIRTSLLSVRHDKNTYCWFLTKWKRWTFKFKATQIVYSNYWLCFFCVCNNVSHSAKTTFSGYAFWHYVCFLVSHINLMNSTFSYLYENRLILLLNIFKEKPYYIHIGFLGKSLENWV